MSIVESGKEEREGVSEARRSEISGCEENVVGWKRDGEIGENEV